MFKLFFNLMIMIGFSFAALQIPDSIVENTVGNIPILNDFANFKVIRNG